MGEGLVALLPVGEEEELRSAGGLPVEGRAVPLLVFLLPRHPQGLGGDLFEVSLPGQEQVDRVGGHVLLLRHLLRQLILEENLRAAVLPVGFLHRLQLPDDLLLNPGGLGDEVGQVGDVLFQLLGLGGAL